jgi:predicted nucleotidyltransferase
VDTTARSQRTGVPPEELLQEAVRLLLEAARPQKIILFGSAACGEMHGDSDLDFLVILPEVSNRHAEMVKLGMALRPLHMPIDVLVYSADEVEDRGQLRWTTLYVALHEGKVLYDAA